SMPGVSRRSSSAGSFPDAGCKRPSGGGSAAKRGLRRPPDMSELSVADRLPVRVVTIEGEPRMNVLSRALVAELSAQARRAAQDDAVRAVVLTGRGARAFCAGANLKERRGWTDDDIRAWLVELHTALREVERCPRPWIAALTGLALGGGAQPAPRC